jgi:hypothetical protein
MQVTPRNVKDIQKADLLVISYLFVDIFTVSPSVLHRPEITSENLALVEMLQLNRTSCADFQDYRPVVE